MLAEHSRLTFTVSGSLTMEKERQLLSLPPMPSSPSPRLLCRSLPPFPPLSPFPPFTAGCGPNCILAGVLRRVPADQPAGVCWCRWRRSALLQLRSRFCFSFPPLLFFSRWRSFVCLSILLFLGASVCPVLWQTGCRSVSRPPSPTPTWLVPLRHCAFRPSQLCLFSFSPVLCCPPLHLVHWLPAAILGAPLPRLLPASHPYVFPSLVLP